MSFWSRIERGIESIAGDLIPDEFRERLSGARKNLESGQLAEAETELQDLVRLRPDHAAAQTLLGVTLLSQEKIDAARDAFDRALALDAELPEALIGRGNTALVADSPELAIPYFRDAIDAAGGDQELLSEVYHALGRAYRSSGDLGKAIRELRKAAAESGGNSAIIADLGDALSIDGSRSHTEARRYL
ncbi:MAG: tetratricopeptide repeat protein [Kofleriaceae bacterium]|nr:tetratricopeptide repeat protein [Kofleriaceae bacterium]